LQRKNIFFENLFAKKLFLAYFGKELNLSYKKIYLCKAVFEKNIFTFANEYFNLAKTIFPFKV
jgi:hypothetical protein